MNTNNTSNRADLLIAFHEHTTPFVKLLPWTFGASLLTALLTGGTPNLLPLANAAFFAAMASLAAAVFFGLPWLAGRGYKLHATDDALASRRDALAARSLALHAR